MVWCGTPKPAKSGFPTGCRDFLRAHCVIKPSGDQQQCLNHRELHATCRQHALCQVLHAFLHVHLVPCLSSLLLASAFCCLEQLEQPVGREKDRESQDDQREVRIWTEDQRRGSSSMIILPSYRLSFAWTPQSLRPPPPVLARDVFRSPLPPPHRLPAAPRPPRPKPPSRPVAHTHAGLGRRHRAVSICLITSSRSGESWSQSRSQGGRSSGLFPRPTFRF